VWISLKIRERPPVVPPGNTTPFNALQNPQITVSRFLPCSALLHSIMERSKSTKESLLGVETPQSRGNLIVHIKERINNDSVAQELASYLRSNFPEWKIIRHGLTIHRSFNFLASKVEAIIDYLRTNKMTIRMSGRILTASISPDDFPDSCKAVALSAGFSKVSLVLLQAHFYENWGEIAPLAVAYHKLQTASGRHRTVLLIFHDQATRDACLSTHGKFTFRNTSAILSRFESTQLNTYSNVQTDLSLHPDIAFETVKDKIPEQLLIQPAAS
jgi:hypothetical protein